MGVTPGPLEGVGGSLQHFEAWVQRSGLGGRGRGLRAKIWVAPTCPRPRFARRGQASRIFIENAKRRQAARSAACPFDCAGRFVGREAASNRARNFPFAFKTLRCERVFPLRSKRFAVSMLEFSKLHSLYAQSGCACERVFRLRSKRFAMSVLETFDGAVMNAFRQAQAENHVLSVKRTGGGLGPRPLRGLRPSPAQTGVSPFCSPKALSPAPPAH